MKPFQERPVALAGNETGIGLVLAGNTQTGSEVTHKIRIKFSKFTEKLYLRLLSSYSLHTAQSFLRS
jgi:hypothetical protein